MKKFYCCRRDIFRWTALSFLVLFSSITLGQFYKPGNAPTLWPPNGFGAEGDAYVNVWLYPTTTPNNIGDWFFTAPPDPAYPGTGGSIFSATGDTNSPGGSNTAILAHFVDGYRGDPGGDLTVFAESDKIEDNPNTYDVLPGSVPPKDDMQHADGVFTYGDPSLGPFVPWNAVGHETAYSAVGVSTDLWCLFACDRWKINGASYADFEFNQNAIDFDPVTGLFTTHAPVLDADGDPTGGRTPGDVLITVEFTQGGAVGDVWVDKWLKAAPGEAYHWVTQDITTGVYVNALFASFNNVNNHVPWPIYDQTPVADGHYVYAPNQYIEGAINLTQVMETTNQQCGTLATIWVRTKSSHSSTAQLKDLAGIFNVGIVPDPPVVVCPDPVELGPCPSLDDVQAAYDTWKAGFSYSGGTEPVTETFDVDLPDDLPADAICGYDLTVMYKASDFCSQADSCTSTFSVLEPVTLEVSCPAPVLIDLFLPQADVDAAFYDWLAEFSSSGGCNPTLPDMDYLPPNRCGGIVEITYSVTDECGQSAECSSYFLVDFSTDISLICPEDRIEDACQTQQAIDDAFDAWVAELSYSLECDPVLTTDPEILVAPSACGGSITVTFTVDNACEDPISCTRTFTVLDAPVLDAYCPGDVNLGSCLSQAVVDAEFADWIAGFGNTGGCNATATDLGGLSAPNACGGSVYVLYEASDDCDQYDWCEATFLVENAPLLYAYCPGDVSLGSCMSQDAVDAEFADWIAGFGYIGGCNTIATDISGYVAPNACGGSVYILYEASDDCNQSGECAATFSVEYAPILDAYCPGDLTMASCFSQDVVDGEFASWLAGFGNSGGCNTLATDLSGYVAPDACGGSVTILYQASDDCGQSDECEATFSVEYAPVLDAYCPGDVSLSSCMSQDDVDAEFALWLAGFGNSGGCNTLATDLSGYAAPDACGGSVTILYQASDDCGQSDECEATFSVEYAPILDAYCPGDVSLSSCMSQDDVDAEFALWLAGFGNTGGCNTLATDLSGYAAPDACGGSVTILYQASDDCGQSDECEATFSVEYAPLLDAYCPGDVSLSSCMSQDDVDAEFALWLAGFGNTGGCNVSATDLSGYTAPDACGGSVSILYEASDDCGQYDYCEATFSVAEPDPIQINCPNAVALPACTPSADITTAYNTWKAGFTSSGDCNLTDNIASFPPLVVQADGSVSLSFTYIVTGDCDNTEHTCSSTFTAEPCAPNCNTAYAKIADPNSVCFLSDGFSQWGWTNYIAAEGVYVLPLYAGAAGCQFSDDNYVGTATVTYLAGTVTVQYQIIAGFAMDQAHVNVSCDKYPKKKGKWTVAPGQYTFVQNSLNNLSGLTVSFTNISGPIWVIIHAETCDIQGSGTATFGPYALNLSCAGGAKDLPVATSDEIDVNIHPNPFIQSTDIDFSLPSDQEVTVEVYNSLGEKISTLFHDMVNADQKYQVRFTLPNQSGQGMYLCVIRTEQGYIVKPMIVTR